MEIEGTWKSHPESERLGEKSPQLDSRYVSGTEESRNLPEEQKKCTTSLTTGYDSLMKSGGDNFQRTNEGPLGVDRLERVSIPTEKDPARPITIGRGACERSIRESWGKITLKIKKIFRRGLNQHLSSQNAEGITRLKKKNYRPDWRSRK